MDATIHDRSMQIVILLAAFFWTVAMAPTPHGPRIKSVYWDIILEDDSGTEPYEDTLIVQTVEMVDIAFSPDTNCCTLYIPAPATADTTCNVSIPISGTRLPLKAGSMWSTRSMNTIVWQGARLLRPPTRFDKRAGAAPNFDAWGGGW